MTCRVLTPWWISREATPPAQEVVGSTGATAVLDTSSDAVRRLAREAWAGSGGDDRAALQRAHRLIAGAVRPVYAVEELQPASMTLQRAVGSCSQRMAVLEAVARSLGIATRVRGLLVDGAFWYPRFPWARRLVPSTVLLAWPEFRIEGDWVPVSGLFGEPDAEAPAFTNDRAETLFDAVARRAVDPERVVACSAPGCSDDLSAAVRRDLGLFTSRDELFAVHGQTLCRPARTVAGPVLGRIRAGAA